MDGAGSTGTAMAMAGADVGDKFIQRCFRGKLQEAKTLASSGASVNYQNEDGCTALHAAAAAGQLEVVEWLLNQEETYPKVVDELGQTALFYAAFHGHLEVVQLFVERGVPLDMQDKHGRLVHNAAAVNGHLDVVSYLLEECDDPIDINAIDSYGGTCLHWAALKGRKEVVQYLCRNGIDVHLTSYDNRTALQLAKDKHKLKCVQFLKSWVELLQEFVSAAEEGNNEEIKRIIALVDGAYPLRYLRDKDGRNALNWAAASGHLETMKILAEHFDDLTDVDKYGRNALHWAALGGHKPCVRWLITKAKDTSLVRTLTLTYKSPSRCAFEAGHAGIASKLQSLEEGHDEVVGAKEFKISPPESPLEGNGSKDAVGCWLKSLDMGEYSGGFHTDGFDTLRGVTTINEKDLVDMNVKKGHRRVVLSEIDTLKHQLCTLDERNKVAGKEFDVAPSFLSLPEVTQDDISESGAAAAAGAGAEVAEGDLPKVDGDGKAAVKEWLKLLDLTEYAETFASDGFDNLRGAATIDEKDLVDMNVKKGHRRVLLSGVSDLRQQLLLLDKKNEEEGKEFDRAPTLASLPQLIKSTAPGTTEDSVEKGAEEALDSGRESVSAWLSAHDLQEYREIFSKDGFDTLRGVATVDEKDLVDMNVKKGHRRVVLSGVEALKQQLVLLDEQNEAAGIEKVNAPSLASLPQLKKSAQDDSEKVPASSSTAVVPPSNGTTTTMTTEVTSQKPQSPVVIEWLKGLELEEYASKFAEDGFDTLRGFALINEDDVGEMNMKKCHGRILLSGVEVLKQRLALLDQQNQGEDAEPTTLSSLPSFIPPSSAAAVVAPPVETVETQPSDV